jgi:inosose dehydratase
MTSLNRSRRQFLTSSSAACLASIAAGSHSLASNESDPWGGFAIGVQTISLRKYSLPEVFRHLQGIGVRYVEFSASAHLPATANDQQIAEARQLAAAAGLRISAQGVNRFTSDHAANRRVFEFAKKLGIRIITANPQPDSDTFASLEKLVAEYDMRIAVHNHGPGSLYDKLTDVTKVLKDRDPRIGACVDCGHFIASGEDPLQCLRTLSDRLYGVHLKDQSAFGSKSPGVILGKGHLDLVSLFKTLRQINFPPDGALSLEYEANPDNPLDDLKACLAATKDAIARSV